MNNLILLLALLTVALASTLIVTIVEYYKMKKKYREAQRNYIDEQVAHLKLQQEYLSFIDIASAAVGIDTTQD